MNQMKVCACKFFFLAYTSTRVSGLGPGGQRMFAENVVLLPISVAFLGKF